MIASIKRFFENHIVPEAGGGGDSQHSLRLAIAVLLVEVAEADYQDKPEEREALQKCVREQFGLEPSEAEELIELARSEHTNSTDYYQFTSLINSQYKPDEKAAIIDGLWQIAFADNQLHHYEEHVIRRLAELLHVPHGQFIASKHRVMGKA